MSFEKKIPTSHLGRMARVAAAGARLGASKLLGNDPTDPAAKAAELLGTLRGVAAKLGQMASYVDGVVPEEHRGAFEKGMKGLQSAAPRSSSLEIRKTVERELKAPMDKLFAAWDDVPMASASVGQVHRARLQNGQDVAVKVQHPGIVEAMESDLDNIGLLENLVALGGSRRFDSKRLFDEAATRLREELDYGLEATRQEQFGALHQNDPQISIPQVIRSHSTRHVLTTELVSGLKFDDACLAPELARQQWAATLWRFVYKGNLVGGMFNADPHPGNYFFNPDGKVTFLDFGCVQLIEPHRMGQSNAMHRAARARDEVAFRQAVHVLLDLKGGGHEHRTQKHMRDIYEPLFKSPFHVSREYTTRLLRQMRELGAEAQKAGHDDHYVPLPEGALFLNRLQFGFYSILARLNVTVDYAQVERDFLGETKA